MIVSIGLSSTLSDVHGPPLIEKEKHLIAREAVQRIQQQLKLFVIIGIRARKDSLSLPPFVAGTAQNSSESAPRNDLSKRVLVGLEKRGLRPIRAIKTKRSWFVMQNLKDAFCSLRTMI